MSRRYTCSTLQQSTEALLVIELTLDKDYVVCKSDGKAVRAPAVSAGMTLFGFGQQRFNNVGDFVNPDKAGNTLSSVIDGAGALGDIGQCFVYDTLKFRFSVVNTLFYLALQE